MGKYLTREGEAVARVFAGIVIIGILLYFIFGNAQMYYERADWDPEHPGYVHEVRTSSDPEER